MKRLSFLLMFLFLLNIGSFGEIELPSIEIKAKEFGPEIGRQDFELAYASSVKGQGNYKTQILYIAQFHVIRLIITNNSDKVLSVNPNFFTLVTDNKRSCSYSAETYIFKNKIGFLNISPIENVDVYPGTNTEGFLLFEKREKDERPATLYFKNPDLFLSINVLLDEKVKTKE